MPATAEISAYDLAATLKAQYKEPVFHCFMHIPFELILGIMEKMPWKDLQNLLLTKNMTLYNIWGRYRKNMFATILTREFPTFQGWFFSVVSRISYTQLLEQQHHFAVALGEDQGFLTPATYQSNINEVRQLKTWRYLHFLDQFMIQVDRDLESFRRLNRGGNINLDASALDEGVLRRALFLLWRLRWRDLQAYEPRKIFHLLHFSPLPGERARMGRSHSIVQRQPERDRTAFVNLLETMACVMINSWNLAADARSVYQFYQILGSHQGEESLKKFMRWHLCGLLVSVILRIGVRNTERLLTAEHDADKETVRRIRVTWKWEINLDLRRIAAGQTNQMSSHSILGLGFCSSIGMWRP